MQSRFDDYEYCPGGEFLPSLDFRPLELGLPFAYDSSTASGGIYARAFNVYSEPTGSTNSIRYVKSYNFTLSAPSGRTPLWKFQALLGHHFLAGGNIRTILVPGELDPSRCLFVSIF